MLKSRIFTLNSNQETKQISVFVVVCSDCAHQYSLMVLTGEVPMSEESNIEVIDRRPVTQSSHILYSPSLMSRIPVNN